MTHRAETCDIEEIETTAIRALARQWAEAGRQLEAGNQMTGDYVYDIATGVAVYEHIGKYVADNGRERESQFDTARDAAQMALGYLNEAQTGGGQP